jgi:hypothetical protein
VAGAGTVSWQYWNVLSTTAASTNCTLTTQLVTVPVWETWNSTNYLATTTTMSASIESIQVKGHIWENWNAFNFQFSGNPRIEVVRAPEPETPEQVAAREESLRQAREATAERQRRQQQAAGKALALLMSLLDEEQQASYRDRGYFDLTGSRGRRWRIEKRGQAGNVLLLPEDPAQTEAQAYCCHPPDSLPLADAHLAQALHLVTDEDDFERTANRSGRRHLQAVA